MTLEEQGRVGGADSDATGRWPSGESGGDDAARAAGDDLARGVAVAVNRDVEEVLAPWVSMMRVGSGSSPWLDGWARMPSRCLCVDPRDE